MEAVAAAAAPFEAGAGAAGLFLPSLGTDLDAGGSSFLATRLTEDGWGKHENGSAAHTDVSRPVDRCERWERAGRSKWTK